MAEYTDTIPLVRALSADMGATPLVSDETLLALLTLYNGDARRAASRALRTVAASEVLVSKKIRTQDLQTDGPAVSAELRALADSLWDEADALDAAADASYFEFTGFGERPGIEAEEARSWLL